MVTQDINVQSPLPNSHIRFFLVAKKFGFKFKIAEQKHTTRCDSKSEIIKDIGEQPKPFKVVLSLICIGIAIVFAFIEAQNVKTTIIGATGMSDTAAVIVGWAFAAAGLVAGHLLSTTWKRDEFAGRYKPTPLFYVGLAFTLIYLSGQYYLASRAGVGTGEEMQETVTTLKWFILGIALAEVLFGIAFLGTAIKVTTLLWVNIRIKIIIGKMNRNSKSCEEAWQKYSFENHGGNLLEPTQAIIDARTYYNNGGIYNDNYSDN